MNGSSDGARDEVLARVRAAVGPDPPVPAVPRTYRTQGEHAPGHPALLDLLDERLTDYRAVVRRVPAGGLPTAVDEALAAHSVSRVVVPPGLPEHWRPRAVEHVVDDGALTAEALDAFGAVLTGCAVAIAETGTLVLDASPDQGRRALSLVPDLHVCVVDVHRVVQTVPEAVARLDPTRPITLVSGPSATSDIELDRVEGVHGPRRLHVLLTEHPDG